MYLTKLKYFHKKSEVNYFCLFINCLGGALRGYTGKELLNYVVIGIGGSYLGIEFVYEAIKNSPLVK